MNITKNQAGMNINIFKSGYIFFASLFFLCGINGKEINPKENIFKMLLPRPQYLSFHNNYVKLDSTWTIKVSVPALMNESKWLGAELKRKTGLALKTENKKAASISLILLDGKQQICDDFKTYDLNSADIPKLKAEGYYLKIYGGKSPEIIIKGYTPTGIFYGVNTLVQLINHDNKIPSVSILDYPNHKMRGIMCTSVTLKTGKNGNLEFTPNIKEQIDCLARMKFNTIPAFEFTANPYGDFNKSKQYWQAYHELYRYVRSRHINYIPLVGTLRDIREIPLEFSEGYWIQDQPFVFRVDNLAYPVRQSTELVINGDFEKDTDNDNQPDGWKSVNPKSSYLVQEQASNGSRCMLLERLSETPELNRPYGGRPLFNTKIKDIKPNSSYICKFNYRGNFYTGKGCYLQLRNFSSDGRMTDDKYVFIRPKAAWQTYRFLINTKANDASAKLRFFILPGATGKIWIDQVSVKPMNALLNVIRTKETDIEIKSADNKIIYQLGKDYEIIDGYFPPSPQPNNPLKIKGVQLDQKAFQIKRLPGSRIAIGQAFLVDYDRFVPTSSYCVLNERVYKDYIFPAIDRIITNFHPKYIFCGSDEITGFATNRQCRKSGLTNAQLFAEWANRIDEYIRSKAPDCRMIIWDDMVSPYHNGDKIHFYSSAPGRMAEAIEKSLLNKTIIMASWYYNNYGLCKMDLGCRIYARKGYKYFGVPWCYTDNCILWSQVLCDRPGAIGCMLNSSFWRYPDDEAVKAKVDKLRTVCADYFWNSRGKVIWVDYFEKDQDHNGLPDGWQATGAVKHIKNGPRIENAAIGMAAAGGPNKNSVLIYNGSEITDKPKKITPGSTYELTIYIKPEASNMNVTPSLHINWLDDKYKVINKAGREVKLSNHRFQAYSLSAIAPSRASFMTITIAVAGKNKCGCYFDNLYIVKHDK